MNTLLQIETLGVIVTGVLLILEEVRRIGRLITPLTLMVVPFLVILFLMNFVLLYYGYPIVTEKVMVFLWVQFILFWLIGRVMFTLFNQPYRPDFNYRHLEHQLARVAPLIIFLALISVIVISGKALNLLKANGGLAYYAHPHYEKFMNRGASAHFIQLAKVCFFLLIVAYRAFKPRWILWVVFILLSFALMLVQVKYHILHLLLMGLLYFSLNYDIKKQLKILAGTAVLLIVMFNLFWFLVARAAGISDPQVLIQAIFRYSVNYLASGTVSLDIWMAHSNVMPEWAPLVTFKNILNVILGNPYRYNIVRVVSLDFMDVGPGLITNVGTAFGPFFLIGGWLLAVSYTVVSAFLYYSFYFLAARFKHVVILFLNLLFLVFSTFTFFVQYFLLLSTIEMPLLLMGLMGALALARWSNQLMLKEQLA